MNTKKACLLKRIEDEEKTAKEFGFYWERLDQLLEQARSECVEIEEAAQNNHRDHLKEEIGDLLHTAVCMAVFCEFDPYETLLEATNKFQKRYQNVVALATQDGHENLKGQSMSLLMEYWKRAKKL